MRGGWSGVEEGGWLCLVKGITPLRELFRSPYLLACCRTCIFGLWYSHILLSSYCIMQRFCRDVLMSDLYDSTTYLLLLKFLPPNMVQRVYDSVIITGWHISHTHWRQFNLSFSLYW